MLVDIYETVALC